MICQAKDPAFCMRFKVHRNFTLDCDEITLERRRQGNIPPKWDTEEKVLTDAITKIEREISRVQKEHNLVRQNSGAVNEDKLIAARFR